MLLEPCQHKLDLLDPLTVNLTPPKFSIPSLAFRVSESCMELLIFELTSHSHIRMGLLRLTFTRAASVIVCQDRCGA